MADADNVMTGSIASKKERSPSFPFITLTKALERLSAVYKEAKRHEARLPEVATALGLGAKSSGTLQTVAALISFGLLDGSGSGDSRKFRVSDLAFKILEDHRPGAKEGGLREAALKPRLIAEYAESWRNGRPNDAICISELRIDRGFTEEGAAVFLRVFDDAIRYAQCSSHDKKSDADSNGAALTNSPPPNAQIEIGDLVQWEVDGVLRLERPTAVRAIQEQEGQEWAFVDGSETGIRMEELILDQKGALHRPAPPKLPLPAANRSDVSPDLTGMDVDRFTVDEGVVQVEFPKAMGTASVDELDQFFQLFIKKAKRRATAASKT